MSSQFANPQLYGLLKAAVELGVLTAPNNTISVLRPGVVCQTQREAKGTGGFLKIIRRGEEFQINCPFCHDLRGRLSISHVWGTTDPETRQRLNVIHCYNPECQSHPENLIALRQKLDPFSLSAAKYNVGATAGQVPVMVTNKFHNSSGACKKMPGPTVPMDMLADDHPASIWAAGRKRPLSAAVHAKNYGVVYCRESRMANAAERLIFPVKLHGKLIGWQARYIGADGSGSVKDLYRCKECGLFHIPTEGLDKEEKEALIKRCSTCGTAMIKEPKWWTSPGFAKSANLYNFDEAVNWPFCVIVEGAGDVQGVGSPDDPDRPGPGIATFGKSLSDAQCETIAKHWTAAVVLYDPNTWGDGSNACIMAYSQLRAAGMKRVVAVRLNDWDPGDAPHAALWKLITRRSHEAGIDLAQLIDKAC